MNRQFRINRQFILKIAAPTIVISALLLALGIGAAWSVHRQHINSSELIAKEVHGMIAAQDLYIEMREIRHQLQQFGRVRSRRHVDEIQSLRQTAMEHVAQAESLARTPDEESSIQVVQERWATFSQDFDQFVADQPMPTGEVDARIDALLNDITNVIDPARKFLTLNRDVVDKTNAANQHTTQLAQQGFLLLGITGAAAGLVAGLLIAQGISRSIVQLDVSVRSVAGRLQGVVGPVQISRGGNFREFETGLQEMENHIATVVERLQQRELEVLRSEQLAALGQLAAGLAHELRNPLMPMKMLVQAAVERDDGVGLSGPQLVVVEEEITRLEESIQDFLDFARPPKLEKRLLDLRLAIEQVFELVSGRAERQQIQLLDDIPNDAVLVEADAGQLRQVLLNLLLNAFDALPDGGQVYLAVFRCRPPKDCVPPQPALPSNWVALTIRDSGLGLPVEVLDRIFEPFVSSKETGTGLGLSICRRIVEAHDGRIVAANVPGGGAMFTIYLPLAVS